MHRLKVVFRVSSKEKFSLLLEREKKSLVGDIPWVYCKVKESKRIG